MYTQKNNRSSWAAHRSIGQFYPRFTSIAAQLRYGLVLLVLLSLLLTGGLLIQSSFQAQLQQLQQLQQMRSRTAAGQIDNYLDDLKRKLNYLARVRGLTQFQPQVQQDLLEGLTRHNDAYETLAIVDRTGQVVVAVSPYSSTPFGNIANSPLFLRAFKQQEDYISPVEIDPQIQRPIVTIAVPIRNEQDEVDGVLLARVNLNFLWFVVSQIEVGKTGYVYIVDERNILIAQKGRTPDTFQLQDLSDRPLIHHLKPLESASQIEAYPGLNQVKVLGASATIHSTNWSVVSELPTVEAYAPVHQMGVVMGAILAGNTLATLGIGFFFSRQIVVPLKHLTDAATEISAGQLNTRVQFHHRNELGALAIAFNNMATQLEELIAAVEVERNFVSTILDIAGAIVIVLNPQGHIVRFNRASEEITGYRFSEVKDQYFWTLYSDVEAAQQTKNDFASLNASDFPQQYEKHWRMKDKRSRLIAWSDTVLLNEHDTIAYIIKTGIDITERKQSEQLLRQSEALLRQQAQELEQTLKELKQTQAQLVQTEKMSSLGQLVAGVAHEINNPVSFIYGNLVHAHEYVKDLLHLLSLYQQHYPQPYPAIQQEAETIELDFLMEDLPKLLNSMRTGAERIQEIVLSLRNFSRMDEAEVKPVNIHEGIDSTLMILQNRLKEMAGHPGIEVIKRYGQLPEVECYAGQLNQVFMNILSNAIDALDDYNRKRSSEEIKQNPSTITICTTLITPNRVQICIADNGLGMSETVRHRIFEPFFTTKSIGKGTGLGLSISYQVITEKHGGTLACVSMPGQGAEFIIQLPLHLS
jgi:PAS domain S-box-containing protein